MPHKIQRCLCRHNISGRKIQVPVDSLIENLTHKADWLMEHIRKTEWIQGQEDEGWFNSYYDNHSMPVEGYFEQGVRMMLTGQVFAIMGGVAEDRQIQKIVKSADHYLYQKEIGGYRLNTDFHELKFDMGRMFGFAYGEKENGAVFSHMTVMYANALYQRGFVKEGYKALSTLLATAMDFKTSRIYPGVPEYFDADGRGMYQYGEGSSVCSNRIPPKWGGSLTRNPAAHRRLYFPHRPSCSSPRPPHRRMSASGAYQDPTPSRADRPGGNIRSAAPPFLPCPIPPAMRRL